jgi:hypothetical protein
MSESPDPFDVLGVAKASDEQALRAAFRAMALRHHPDRNPDDPTATERFKRVMRAYHEALRQLRGERPVTRRPAHEESQGRYRCTGCGDRFVVDASCPRCEIAVQDTLGGVEASKPRRAVRLDAWADALEARGPRTPWIDFGKTRHAPMVIAAGFFAAAVLVYGMGPLLPAVMCGMFGAWVAAMEAHARLRPLV